MHVPIGASSKISIVAACDATSRQLGQQCILMQRSEVSPIAAVIEAIRHQIFADRRTDCE